MPNIESAKKRMRQNAERRLRNRSVMSRMRTAIKSFRKLVEEKKLDEARASLPKVYAVIDRTARHGVIHRNTAARYKSRLTTLLNAQATPAG